MTDNFQGSKKKSDRGFTLIEVLIALFCFSIGILGLGALQLNSIKSVTKADTVTKATALAHSQVELLKSLPMDDANVTGNSAITQNGSFWTQSIVTNDFPLGQRKVDSGDGLMDTTVCRTIEIKVFEDSAGSKPLASTSFIVSYTALE